MSWTFTGDKAIYQQIVEHIRGDILRGIYPPGSRLPSVRDLALEAAVNPNTMQRAFQALEDSGLVSAQRTAGRFVTEDAALLDAVRRELAGRCADAYLQQSADLGLTRAEAIALLEAQGGNHK